MSICTDVQAVERKSDLWCHWNRRTLSSASLRPEPSSQQLALVPIGEQTQPGLEFHQYIYISIWSPRLSLECKIVNISYLYEEYVNSCILYNSPHDLPFTVNDGGTSSPDPVVAKATSSHLLSYVGIQNIIKFKRLIGCLPRDNITQCERPNNFLFYFQSFVIFLPNAFISYIFHFFWVLPRSLLNCEHKIPIYSFPSISLLRTLVVV